MPLLCQPNYAEDTRMLVGGDVGVSPAKVRSQVQCFRGGVLQVELLGIGKAARYPNVQRAVMCIYQHQTSINAPSANASSNASSIVILVFLRVKRCL